MRIAYFDFTNNFGGGPQGVVHLAERLSDRNEVHIIDAYGRCEAYRKAVLEAGLNYHVLLPEARHIYIGGSGWRRIAALTQQIPELNQLRLKLAHTILQIDPDIIWVMNEKSLMLVTLNMRLRHYPAAIYIQGWGTPNQISWRLRFLMRRRVQAVIAVSTATENQLRKAGVPKSKLFLGSMTIDIEKVKNLACQPLLSVAAGQPLAPKILILAARPERAKGHLAAFKAVARLKSAGFNPSLWMTGRVGVGVKNDFVDELKRLSEQLNIEENLFYLGWQENIPAVIQEADICILPSHTEGFPRSILESMVLKKPVIATDVGGITDSVKDGCTGFLMPIDDDEALACIIEKLVKAPSLVQRVTQQAFDYVIEHFHPDRHTAGIERIFETVIKNGSISDVK